MAKLPPEAMFSQFFMAYDLIHAGFSSILSIFAIELRGGLDISHFEQQTFPKENLIAINFANLSEDLRKNFRVHP